MTPQHIVKVDLNEIKALEIRCKCGSVITIPVPNAGPKDFVDCVGCNSRLWDGSQDQKYLMLFELTRSLANWKNYSVPLKGRMPFSIGFSLDQNHEV